MFSDSVLYNASEKYRQVETSQRWYNVKMKDIDSKDLNLFYHVFPDGTTTETLSRTRAHISETLDDHGQPCAPSTYPHRITFTGMMNIVEISPNERNSQRHHVNAKTTQDFIKQV